MSLTFLRGQTRKIILVLKLYFDKDILLLLETSLFLDFHFPSQIDQMPLTVFLPQGLKTTVSSIYGSQSKSIK